MSGVAEGAPAPGPAGWILAAAVSVSLHILGVTGLMLGLAGQPQAPAAPGTGLVIKTLPPVTGTAPTLSRPDPARAPARSAPDTPARARLTALDDGAAPAPEAPRTRVAPVSAAPAMRRADVPKARPMQGARARATASSSRPETAPARRIAPLEARPRPAPVRAAPDHAPRRVAAAETPARVAPLQPSAIHADNRPENRPDDRAETRADTRPVAVRLDEPGATRPTPLAATRPEPAETSRLSPAAPGRSTPPPASVLAPTQRQATATRPRRQAAPVPQETRDPASRARRDGPDRRLSDRQAAPAAAPDRAVALDGPAAARLRRALQALQAPDGTRCHTARPLLRSDAAPAIAVFGSDAAPRAAERPGPDWPDMAPQPVTQAQCPALDFVRETGDDALAGIRLDLWSPVAGDRQPLAGVVVHDGPVALHLLLIDTAGQVHDLQRFLQPVAGGSQFLVPMTGAGEIGVHRQLLLAIAAPVAFPLPGADMPRAGAFFAALRDTLTRRGITPDLALAGFLFE